MSTKVQLRAYATLAAFAFACASSGCVADRPARNGVFNENQYLRKEFLIRPGDSQTADPGWFLKATIMTASEPNPFGDSNVYGLFAGSHSNGDLVHFIVSQDKLQMISSRELGTQARPAGLPDPVGRQPEILNAWPAVNVDLKYRVNLDGEKTNFYEENLELDWQTRQWVKVNFDKNDMSDLSPLGDFYNANVAHCADLVNASATLVPNSFNVDEPNEYIEWSVQITIPVNFQDTTCMDAFGVNGVNAQRLGRQNETVTLKYSLMRAKPAGGPMDYQPMPLAEKDPIRHKYGPLTYTSFNRDMNTGLEAATEYVIRYDPTKPIVWYFEQGFPDAYKNIFTSHNLPANVPPLPNGIPTIEDATNGLMQTANVPARVSFAEYNVPDANGNAVTRNFGDIRYNMVRFVQTLDQQESFAGVTSPVVDPRTGENLSTDIVFDNFTIQDYYVTRIDAYLRSIGASEGLFTSDKEWGPNPTGATCTAGASIPLIPKTVVQNHDALSTLYGKMQAYLYRPIQTAGPQGPQDFIVPHNNDNGDFYRAYFAYLPYIVYGDPALNQFVTPEGGQGSTNPNAEGGSLSSQLWSKLKTEAQFHQIAAQIDSGWNPYDINSPTGTADATNFLKNYKELSINHRDLAQTKQSARFALGSGRPLAQTDNIPDFAIESVMQKDARHCVPDANGQLHWETKQEWINNLLATYWSQVFWHEFGHAMGLGHNFMASVDKNNFPNPVQHKNADGSTFTTYSLYASSVMEYNAVPDRVFWGAGWAPYDQGAIGWIYANPSGIPNAVPTGAVAQGISGQVTPNAPWNDPKGFTADGKTETQFLFCDERHTRYTPLCRAGDLGTTPSEIIANEIENYEWQYQWRNFRQYRKVWDESKYADQPLNFITDMRRFISLWAFDMGPGEVTQNLQRLGIGPPKDGSAPSTQAYYQQLTSKFSNEMSMTNSMVAAFHEALIQQSSGQRPFKSTYDAYYGDVTEQGITLDKLDALQSWLALWPVDNYDPNQAAGAYIASYSPFGFASEINGTGIGALYQTVAEQAVDSMIGGSYDAFAYFKELGISQFNTDTHSINYTNAIAGASRSEVQDWGGGWVKNRLADFLAFFQDQAAQVGLVDPINGFDCSPSGAVSGKCTYDPRNFRAYAGDVHYSDTYNEFLGPDGRRYIWAYLRDRDQYVWCDRDRNTATYQILRNYTTDVVLQKDDGNYGGAAFADELQIKYFIDYYYQANNTPH